jgi:RNA recognition motif-containing protein
MSDDMTTNNKKLFVGNLPFSATEDQLRESFGQYGEIVDCKLISDRMTGRSKGFAFVEFAEESMAAAAIEGMNGKDMEGRAMVVNVARPPAPREDRGPRRDFGGGRGGFGGGRGGYGGSRGGYGGGGSRY